MLILCLQSCSNTIDFNSLFTVGFTTRDVERRPEIKGLVGLKMVSVEESSSKLRKSYKLYQEVLYKKYSCRGGRYLLAVQMWGQIRITSSCRRVAMPTSSSPLIISLSRFEAAAVPNTLEGPVISS